MWASSGVCDVPKYIFGLWKIWSLDVFLGTRLSWNKRERHAALHSNYIVVTVSESCMFVRNNMPSFTIVIWMLKLKKSKNQRNYIKQWLGGILTTAPTIKLAGNQGKIQLVQKMEWKQTDRRIRPIALGLPFLLARSVRLDPSSDNFRPKALLCKP